MPGYVLYTTSIFSLYRYHTRLCPNSSLPWLKEVEIPVYQFLVYDLHLRYYDHDQSLLY